MVVVLGSRDSGGISVEIMATKPCSWGVRRMGLLRAWIDDCVVDESVH